MAEHRTNWDTSTNKDAFKTLVDDWFDSTEREALVEWPNLCLDLKTSDLYERRGRHAGLGIIEKVGEGENIPIQDSPFDTTKDFTQERYGSGFRITDKMKRYEKIGKFKSLTKSLGLVQREGKDLEIAKMWNNATATTYTDTFDGVEIASASHTTLDDAATGYNNLTATALCMSSLESARNYFDYLYDDQGQIFVATPDTLVVNHSLVVTAEQLLGSTLVAFENSNTKNVLSNWLKIFNYHRLTSTTQWMVLAKNHPKYDYFVYTSALPDTRVEDAPDTTRDTIVSSQQYFTFNCGDPRLAYFGIP